MLQIVRIWVCVCYAGVGPRCVCSCASQRDRSGLADWERLGQGVSGLIRVCLDLAQESDMFASQQCSLFYLVLYIYLAVCIFWHQICQAV